MESLTQLPDRRVGGTPHGHFACIRAPFPAEPVPRVPQHPPDEMPDEGATTGTSHHARLHARASAPAANSCAPALDDTRSSAPALNSRLLTGEKRACSRAVDVPLWDVTPPITSHSAEASHPALAMPR